MAEIGDTLRELNFKFTEFDRRISEGKVKFFLFGVRVVVGVF